MGCDLAVYRARIGTWARRCYATLSTAYVSVRSVGASGVLAAALITALLVIGGLELNPGPDASMECGWCEKGLRSGLQCVTCDLWYHFNCEGLKRGFSGDAWECRECVIRKKVISEQEEKFSALRIEIEGLKKENARFKSLLEQSKGKPEKQYSEVLKSSPDKQKNVEPNQKSSKKVRVFGDSMLRYSGDVCRAKGADVAFYPGAKIEHLTSVISNIKPDDSTKIVLIHVGTNTAKAQPVLDTVQQFRTLGEEARRKFKHAKIVFSGILCRSHVHHRKTWDMNNGLRWVCNKFNFFFIDPNYWINSADLGRDGVHLNRRGAWKLGMLHDSVIEKCLRQV